MINIYLHRDIQLNAIYFVYKLGWLYDCRLSKRVINVFVMLFQLCFSSFSRFCIFLYMFLAYSMLFTYAAYLFSPFILLNSNISLFSSSQHLLQWILRFIHFVYLLPGRICFYQTNFLFLYTYTLRNYNTSTSRKPMFRLYQYYNATHV